jgi:hypothetical protein
VRFIHLYLIGYFLLILGAGLALWRAGVLTQIGGVWVLIGSIIAVGLGIMLAVSARKPAVTPD